MRLDALQKEVGDAMTIEWRAFLLRPAPEPRSLEQFTRYTERWARPAESEPMATFRTWSGEHEPPSFSLPGAIAGKAVWHEFGAEGFDRFHVALMRAYFTDNRTISDDEVILDVAGEVGLDAKTLAVRLATDREAFAAEVVADHKAALAQGIAAVPTAIVNDEYMLQGAMALEQYRKVVARLAS